MRRLARVTQALIVAVLLFVAALLCLTSASFLTAALTTSSAGTLAVLAVVVASLLLIAVIILAIVLVRQAKTLRQLKADHTETMRQLETDALQALRAQWLQEATQTAYRNEIEVEVKFIRPLLTLLGYRVDAYQVRVPITVPVGRQQVRGEADWVIHTHGQPYIVVEAKAPGQQLTASVQDQARSYAEAIRAPWYLLTNGQQLKLYRRGVTRDTCIVDCTVADLPATWPALEEAISANHNP